jgi:hypothetical protein
VRQPNAVARGEILGPIVGALKRRQLSVSCCFAKGEGWGIEDD